MKYYIIAGERSGDLHGSNLIKGIRKHDSSAQIRAWGGDMMQEAGAEVVKHYRDLAFMGFFEVVKNLPTILGFLSFCKKDIKSFQPDVVILIDYAGFNMRVAKFAKTNGFKTFYYISPKVWAWNQSRALKIKQFVDKLFVIFPFETDFFKQYDYEVTYVGNPLFDAIADFTPTPDFRKEVRIGQKPIIAILPGSRKQEVETMLPLMLSQVYEFPDYQFVIGAVSNLPKELYARWQSIFPVKIVLDDAYNLLSVADAALVTSGTATLETALFSVPQVVCYKGGWAAYQVYKRVIRVPFVSLVNLIAGREVVTELLQYDLTKENLTKELTKITLNQETRQAQLDGYQEIKNILGEKGASERAGSLMVSAIKNAI
ncbi:MAG: lipid-A-disaccharide synthase [Arcicella sp.]|jgi:lipid-A-disaccharide synthase|nr:lipid-A-disaccharide synthase [Arcicella sp.]